MDHRCFRLSGNHFRHLDIFTDNIFGFSYVCKINSITDFFHSFRFEWVLYNTNGKNKISLYIFIVIPKFFYIV